MTNFVKIKKNLWLFVLIPILFFIGISVGTSESQNKETGEGLKVTILLFSGRPNPFYFLKDEQMINKVKNLINKSTINKDIREGTVIPSRLGYCGILIDNQGNIPGLPTYTGIYKENIELRNKSVKYLKDDGFLENFLLNQALQKEVIDQKALKFIRSDK